MEYGLRPKTSRYSSIVIGKKHAVNMKNNCVVTCCFVYIFTSRVIIFGIVLVGITKFTLKRGLRVGSERNYFSL